ncbi:hypothetical protein HB943_14720 [Listeria weihenstephanensis]|uniref:Uncharacterized protein n=1 Tax=Listeria weihenstephanensis TaxID=1006155 RepID=A0A841ZB80_9LIST|nr:hypothetical protein [Listeria weihenstephanensis]MBC1501852.1 hypothetical protein [Listeria weihenstephanensis]
MADIIHDFRQTTVNKLDKIIQDSDSSQLGIFDALGDWTVSIPEIEDNSDGEFTRYYEAVLERHDIEKKEFNDILIKVKETDEYFEGRGSSLQVELKTFNDKLRDLSELITPAFITAPQDVWSGIVHYLGTKNTEVLYNELDDSNREMYDQLVDMYGFSEAEAILLTSVYDKSKSISDQELTDNDLGFYIGKRDELFFSIMASFYYANPRGETSILFRIAFINEAGILSIPTSNILLKKMGFDDTQIKSMERAIIKQHNVLINEVDETPLNTNEAGRQYSDFAHFSAVIATLLNPDNKYSDALVSYHGDISSALPLGTPSMGNDDYKADLDAENIKARMQATIPNISYYEASKQYYSELRTGVTTRGGEFKEIMGGDAWLDKYKKESIVDNEVAKKFFEALDNNQNYIE